MSSKVLIPATLFAVGMFSAFVACGQQATQDSVDRDYSDQLPRIPAKSPAEAMKTFQIADGFRIEQVAAEPLTTDPIAMSFDEFGRLFVVEMRGYSEDDKDHLGQIRLLTDRDGDGRFDDSSVYVDGLSWPTAVICYDGGIFVGAAPDILYFKDTDGDGRADQRRVVFTGFGRSNVQGLLNTFQWGLDNRIHGATSSSGASLTRPGVDAPPLQLRGRDFAFDPRTLEIEATSGGAQHGLSFNDWGEKFVCSNSNHAQQVMFEDRYVARNPYLAAPNSRVMIAADGPQADVFRSSPIEPWRIVRTRLRVQKLVPGPVEGGGTPAGYFTGSTGITIFRGTAWPEAYRGWAIVGDVGSNLVHRKKLETAGLQYVARRVDQQSEFLTSTDIWFRPVQFANAPDGALYIADMYREVIEHPKSLPPVIKKHLDLTSGRDRGRIYRIVGDGFQQPALPELGTATVDELVQTLDSANSWHRETAARLLYERQDSAAIAPLQKLAANGSVLGRIHALYALDGIDSLTADVLLQAVRADHPRLVQHAVRLAETIAGESVELRNEMFAMARRPAQGRSALPIEVRYQLAFSLGELPSTTVRNLALAAVIREAVDEPWMRLAVRSSLTAGAGLVLGELAVDTKFAASSAGLAFLRDLAAQIGKQQRAEDIAAVIRVLPHLGDSATAKAIVAALAAKPGGKLGQQLAAASGGRVGEIAKQIRDEAVATASDRNRPTAERLEAIGALTIGGLEDRRAVFGKLLDPTEPLDIQQAAVSSMAAYDEADVAELLIERWDSFSPGVRARAGDVLFSRKSWNDLVITAIEKKHIALADVDPARLRLIAMRTGSDIGGRAAAVLKQMQTGRRDEVIEKYQSALTRKGDAERGFEVFKKTCSACHKIGRVGHEIGPNLAAMKNRGPEAILLNVLDPNREVNPQYLSYALITQDGRTYSGMIAAETATSVTLREKEDKSVTVLRVDIDALRSTGLSLMPEGLEKELSPQAMADVIAYLLSLN